MALSWPWNWGWFGGIQREDDPGQVTETSSAGWTSFGTATSVLLERSYSMSSIVRACVREIACGISSAPLEIVDSEKAKAEEQTKNKPKPKPQAMPELQPNKDDGEEEDLGEDDKGAVIEDDESKEMLAMFYDHPMYDYQILIERMVNSLMLCGVVYAWETHGILIPCLASQVTPQVKGNTLLIDYYNVGQEHVSAKDMIATGFPCPHNYVLWSSPTASMWNLIQLDTQLSNFVAQMVHNRDLTGGVIELPKEATPDQIQRYLETMRQEKNRIGAGTLRVVAGTYRPPEPLEKYDFASLYMQLESRIAAGYGVPPICVGLRAGLEFATYANYKEARKAFYEETLQPIWTKLQRAFTKHFIGYDMGREFRFNTEHVTAQDVETDTGGDAGGGGSSEGQADVMDQKRGPKRGTRPQGNDRYSEPKGEVRG